jgi:hypothetical protein
MAMDFGYGKGAPKPGGVGGDAMQEHAREFGEELRREHEAAAAEPRSGASVLGGILTLAGTILIFVATTLYGNLHEILKAGGIVDSISLGLITWGLPALVLVAGGLALASGRMVRAVAGGIAVGLGGLVLIREVAFLLQWGQHDFTLRLDFHLTLIGCALAVVGGLVAAISAARTTVGAQAPEG